MPKSEAARLAAELDTTTGVVFADRIKAAELHTRSARIARDRFTADHIVELVAEAEPEAHQAVTEFNDLIEQLDRSIVGLGRFAASWAPILETVSGLDMRTELPTLRRPERSTACAAQLPERCPGPVAEEHRHPRRGAATESAAQRRLGVPSHRRGVSRTGTPPRRPSRPDGAAGAPQPTPVR